MIPEEVFHYTSAKVAVEKILFEKQLKLGQIQFTNDPKESKLENIVHLPMIIYNGMPSKKFIRQVIIEQSMIQIASNIKLREWKVLCVSKNHPDLDSKKAATKDNPFLSGSFRPAMWAHYASTHNLHTGVCLKFNGNNLDERISETFKDKRRFAVFSGHIEYNDLKLFELSPIDMTNIHKLNKKGIETRLRNHFIEKYEEIFLRKSRDWENEYEFRWLVHRRRDSPEYISIVDILEEVLVGDEFPQKWWAKLFKRCKELRVPLKRVKWLSGIPFGIPIYY